MAPASVLPMRSLPAVGSDGNWSSFSPSQIVEHRDAALGQRAAWEIELDAVRAAFEQRLPARMFEVGDRFRDHCDRSSPAALSMAKVRRKAESRTAGQNSPTLGRSIDLISELIPPCERSPTASARR